MSRIKVKAALASKPGEEILVKGWVRAFRSNRFIAVNDGSCLANLQVVVDFENFNEALLKKVKRLEILSKKDLIDTGISWKLNSEHYLVFNLENKTEKIFLLIVIPKIRPIKKNR